jgi:protein-disulfide isomerase
MRYFSFLLVGLFFFFQEAAGQSPLKEITYGNRNAPVTLIEYSSFTCGVCSVFMNDILKSLKKEFIDTGKVFFISRDFPMNGVDFKANLIVQASPDPAALHAAIFENQALWFGKKEPLKEIVKIAMRFGMTQKQINQALGDTTAQKMITKMRQEAEEKYDIDGLPIFIIGSKVTAGLMPMKKLRIVLNQALEHVASGKPLATFGKK